MFDISYFRENPLPFYALAHELYPAKYKPTIAHLFLRLLSDKGLLLKVFTQNIDCLEREAGVPEDKIIEAHGSFATQRCIECQSAYPKDMMKEVIQNREVPHCLTPECNGLVKPDIVFFGEALPELFHTNKTLLFSTDLCFTMGTSLAVQPFASLPGLCGDGVPRVLINLERVGNLGSRADDVLLLGDCDSGVRTFAAAMGWAEELEALWTETHGTDITTAPKHPEPSTQSFKDEYLDYQIAELTREVEQSLQISAEHEALVREDLAKKHPQSPSNEESADSSKILTPQSNEEEEEAPAAAAAAEDRIVQADKVQESPAAPIQGSSETQREGSSEHIHSFGESNSP